MIIPDELYLEIIRQALIESGIDNTYINDSEFDQKPTITVESLDSPEYYKRLVWSSFYNVEDPFVIIDVENELQKPDKN